MTQDELKLVLEALEYWDVHGKLHQPTEETITAIKEALAQPEQEPVAWEQFYPDIGKPQIEQPKVRTGDCLLVGVCASEGHKIQAKQEPVADDFFKMIADKNPKHFPLPQRTWVGLTEEEIDDLRDNNFGVSPLISAVEAKLKQKNGYAEENT